MTQHPVDKSLQSLQRETMSALDPCWFAEAERRYQELKSGEVQAVPGDGLAGAAEIREMLLERRLELKLRAEEDCSGA